jgi:hypothetical protein
MCNEVKVERHELLALGSDERGRVHFFEEKGSKIAKKKFPFNSHSDAAQFCFLPRGKNYGSFI